MGLGGRSYQDTLFWSFLRVVASPQSFSGDTSPAPDLIVLDTIGKLYAQGQGLTGYCRPCRQFFRVSMSVLIAV
jgi:hypothetical protein